MGGCRFGDVAKTGLADLLFAELSTLPDIKLVERERLRDVATELALNSFHSPETIEKRISRTFLAMFQVLQTLAGEAGNGIDRRSLLFTIHLHFPKFLANRFWYIPHRKGLELRFNPGI